MNCSENYKKIRSEIPSHVKIVLAIKTRTVSEIKEVINAGAVCLGENYVQEGEKIHNLLGEESKKVEWHFIGKLQKNKINRVLKIFDMVQTIDSLNLARELNKRVKKVLPVLIEVNIAKEENKSGIYPEDVKNLIFEISKLSNLKVKGLMTMGKVSRDNEEGGFYFRKMKKLFDEIKLINISGVSMETLSMGMSDSYKIAIKEGSNMIRLGTIIFGQRE